MSKELNLTDAEKTKLLKLARAAGCTVNDDFWNEIGRLMEKRAAKKAVKIESRPVRRDE